VGDIAFKIREMIREICRAESMDIIKGHISKDHINLFVSTPPQVTISQLIQKLKGKSSYKLPTLGLSSLGTWLFLGWATA